MGKRTYEDYLKSNCHPTGYNEACDSLVFGQSTVDMLLDKISNLEAKFAEKERDFDLLMLSKNEEINEWIAIRDDKNKVIDRQTDKIQELKQQLAVSESEHERLIDTFEEETEKLRKQIKRESDARKRFVEEVKKLKQQLAEKEQIIKILKITVKSLEQKLASQDKIIKNLEEMEYNPKNQPKILFNIEQVDIECTATQTNNDIDNKTTK